MMVYPHVVVRMRDIFIEFDSIYLIIRRITIFFKCLFIAAQFGIVPSEIMSFKLLTGIDKQILDCRHFEVVSAQQKKPLTHNIVQLEVTF